LDRFVPASRAALYVGLDVPCPATPAATIATRMGDGRRRCRRL